MRRRCRRTDSAADARAQLGSGRRHHRDHRRRRPRPRGLATRAVRQATGGETIRFAPELAGATITLDSALVVYKPQLTIEGPADKGITINAAGKDRAMAVNTYDGVGVSLTTLRNLSITGGKVPAGDASGISVGSPLLLEHVTVFGNDGSGPVIYQSGYWPSFVTLVNSSVSGNISASYEAIRTAGDLTLINSTVAENATQGGVFTGAGSKLSPRNSIIAHNGGKSCEVGIATVYAEGKNIASDASCGDAAVTMVADPKLEPLAKNGGPTMTHALAVRRARGRRGERVRLHYGGAGLDCDRHPRRGRVPPRRRGRPSRDTADRELGHAHGGGAVGLARSTQEVVRQPLGHRSPAPECSPSPVAPLTLEEIVMSVFTSRAGRRPLALASGALAIAALAACTDEPTSSLRSAAPAPNASTLADPFTVTNLNDHGIGSLRWVLSYADSGQTIRFDPALAGKTIVLDSVVKMYLKDITIEGPKDRGITLSGGGKTRVLETWGYGPYTLRNLAITGGANSAAAILGGNKVVIENSTLYGNALTGKGTVIAVQRVTLINSTVSGNGLDSTTGYAIAASQGIELINSTVANNAGGGAGDTFSILLRNSIIANNGGRNCNAPLVVTQEGTNLSDDDTCAGPTEIIIADPKLAPLADNGGPTPTHAISAGSPAINVGTSCTVAADQRYVPRTAQCDLGAYEFTDPTTVTLTIDSSVPVSQSNGWGLVSGTVKCSRAETFNLAVQLVQQQKTGKAATTVDAANVVPVECGTIARPWTASMVLTSGAFQNGTATASAQTFGMQPWVTPASATGAVKLYWARR